MYMYYVILYIVKNRKEVLKMKERKIVKEIKDRIEHCECQLDIKLFLSAYTNLITEKEYNHILDWSKLYI